MGFGDTAKKLQKVTSAAEDLYEKMNQLRGQVESLQKEVETTSEQVDVIERDLAEQRTLLEAIAEKQGLDVEALVAEGHGDEASESDSEPEDGNQGAGDPTTDSAG